MLIPDRWRHVLAAVQDKFPDAVIAGGALRDLHFGKTPKDIDIFIRTSLKPDAIMAQLDDAFGHDGDVIWDRGSDTENQYAGNYNNQLTLIADWPYDHPDDAAHNAAHRLAEYCPFDFNATPEETLHFEVIALNMPPPETLSWGDVVTNDFDLGINRIYFDGKAVVKTAAFHIDDAHKTLTVLRCRNERELRRISERVERLKREKYRDFNIQELRIKQ